MAVVSVFFGSGNFPAFTVDSADASAIVIKSAAGTTLLNIDPAGGVTLGSTLTAGDHNIAAGTGAGLKLGTATSQKLGFWNAAPAAQQVLATGAMATADDIITFLQSLGLCRQA